MRITILICCCAGLLISGCKKKETPAPAPSAPKAPGVSVDAPTADAAPPPPVVAQAPETTDAAPDPNAKPTSVPPELMKLKRLCEKYFDDYGRFPARWDDLINAKYIQKVPTGADGKPLDYVEFTRITANP
jgi:hypothetical protein